MAKVMETKPTYETAQRMYKLAIKKDDLDLLENIYEMSDGIKPNIKKMKLPWLVKRQVKKYVKAMK